MTNPSFLPPLSLDGSDEDAILAASSHLTRPEFLARRSRRLKQLARIYEFHLWTLLQHLKYKHRQYYWVFGKSPFKADQRTNSDVYEIFEDQDCNLGIVKCKASGCKNKAMALTRYCRPHVLQDSKQLLYKGCAFVVKRVHGQPKLCRTPVLRSIVPALCPVHFEKAEKYVLGALKSFGLNVSSQRKIAPKLHVIVAEFVRQIQSKRRAITKSFDGAYGKELSWRYGVSAFFVIQVYGYI